MGVKSEYVKEWRRKTKQRIVDAFGGKCGECGYDKCTEALELHHLDPDKKEFSFGSIRANPKRWENIVDELRKCVVLCANCHREYHAGVLYEGEWPKFNEGFAVYKRFQKELFHNDCICGNIKNITREYCCKQCANKHREVVKWDTIDLIDLVVNQKMTKVAVARMMKCSDQAVAKRLKKLQKIN